jgi:hypothetical protein
MTLVSTLNLSSRMTPADPLLVACNTVLPAASFAVTQFCRGMVLNDTLVPAQ